MTSYNEEHFTMLVIKQLSGISTPEEDQIIAETVQVEAAARETYTRLISVLETPELVEHLRTRDPPAEIAAIIGRNPRRRRIGVVAAAAVILLGLIIVSRYIFPSKEELYQKAVTLKLSNGRLINISAASGSIKTKEALLQPDSTILNFTALTEAGTGPNTITVPTGMFYTVVLSDSTVVNLNSGTIMEFPFSFKGKSREITIKGEAYLKVARHGRQAFIVHLPNSTVEVLGTEFNVNTFDSGQARVALVQGALKMVHDQETVLIRPGEQAICSNSAPVRLESFDADFLLSWRKGAYLFGSTKLSALLPVMERWYGVGLVFDQSLIDELIYSGAMDRDKPITSFLDDLQATGSVTWYRKGNSYHLKLSPGPVTEFEGTALSEVLKVAERLYQVPIILDNPAVGRRSFTGIIDPRKSLDSFIAGLKFTHDLRSYKKEDTLHLK